MRRTVNRIFAIVMALALCCSAAFATSKTDVFEITKAVNKNGKPIRVTTGDPDVTITPKEASDIIKKEHKEIGKANPENLSVLAVRKFAADEYPVTITLDVRADVPTYVFMHDGSKWILIGTDAKGIVTVTLNGPTTLALVTGEYGSGGGSRGSRSASGKSYKTGEESIVPLCCGAALAVGAVALAARRKED